MKVFKTIINQGLVLLIFFLIMSSISDLKWSLTKINVSLDNQIKQLSIIEKTLRQVDTNLGEIDSSIKNIKSDLSVTNSYIKDIKSDVDLIRWDVDYIYDDVDDMEKYLRRGW